MNKTFKIYAVIFIIVMIILALLEVNKKETTDWRKNFDIMKNLLLACLFLIMKLNLFKNNLKKIDTAPYEYYNQHQKESIISLSLKTK
jgi:predicted Na+-dependent transporter